MRVKYTLRARADLEEISDYLNVRSPRAAWLVRAKIRSTIDLLAEFPHRGRRQNVPGMRRIAAGRYPYNIYYLLDEGAGEVSILAIRHAARKREFKDN